MKRDMSAKLFLLQQICGFICNYKSIYNCRSCISKTFLNIRTIIQSLQEDLLSIQIDNYEKSVVQTISSGHRPNH